MRALSPILCRLLIIKTSRPQHKLLGTRGWFHISRGTTLIGPAEKAVPALDPLTKINRQRVLGWFPFEAMRRVHLVIPIGLHHTPTL
ncbi:hypothetical protein C8J48_2173 [Desmospora activa DSM 45169]|uniref:Uncharacterized protein n=1 Tax=Desmospora activa DSM 45169 TaxID=1121389 RepID=A0A2T4ZCF2_9BACL|nr:hypothetical protein C8J48_2173 [Desmospora activa DSM 45169]